MLYDPFWDSLTRDQGLADLATYNSWSKMNVLRCKTHPFQQRYRDLKHNKVGSLENTHLICKGTYLKTIVHDHTFLLLSRLLNKKRIQSIISRRFLLLCWRFLFLFFSKDQSIGVFFGKHADNLVAELGEISHESHSISFDGSDGVVVPSSILGPVDHVSFSILGFWTILVRNEVDASLQMRLWSTSFIWWRKKESFARID